MEHIVFTKEDIKIIYREYDNLWGITFESKDKTFNLATRLIKQFKGEMGYVYYVEYGFYDKEGYNSADMFCLYLGKDLKENRCRFYNIKETSFISINEKHIKKYRKILNNEQFYLKLVSALK